MAFLSPYGSNTPGREEAGKISSGHKGVWGQDLAPGDYGLCLRIKDMGKNVLEEKTPELTRQILLSRFSPGSSALALGE